MLRINLSCFLVLMLGLASCKDEPQPITEPNNSVTAENTNATFYFIRHAEKDRSDPNALDPELSQAGLGRAMHWAEILADVPLDKVYTTDLSRTAMTAAPIAIKRDLVETFFDPDTLSMETFKHQNLNKTVLVVGHSNTTPQMINELIGEERYAQMDDHDNGSLFIVQVVNNIPTVQHLNFNCNCPKR